VGRTKQVLGFSTAPIGACIERTHAILFERD
jgi:hypothetical protein